MRKSDVFNLMTLVALVVLELVALFSVTARCQDINDPLNGTTLGQRNGGQFTLSGWKTTDAYSYIQYNVPTTPEGAIEFDVTGLYASSTVWPNCYYDKDGSIICPPEVVDVHYELMAMFDRDDANKWFGAVINGIQLWHNPYKMILHVYGYTDESDQWKWKRLKLRLNVAAFHGGYDDDPNSFEDPAMGPIEWTRDHIYHFKIKWGAGHCFLWLDGVQMKDWDYSGLGATYSPPSQSIRLGSALGNLKIGGFKCPEGITYSNFKFFRSTDTIRPFATGIEPANGDQNVPPDPDILVTFSEPMDTASVRAALRIEPVTAGKITWNGSTMCFTPASVLSPWIPYTVTVAQVAKDLSGNLLLEQVYSVFTPGNLAPVSVGLYETCDILRVSTGNPSNPYTSTTLTGTFTGPTKTITMQGFWDGGKKFRVRMAPTETGHWSWVITSSDPSLAASGSFECVESGKSGFITAQGFGFKYSDGTEWQWRGDTSWRGYTSLFPYSGRWKEIVDLRADQGYTAMQSIVHSFINGNQFWGNEGGSCFSGTDAADYDHLNPEYFRWIDKRLDYLDSKGMVPIMMFTWAQDYAAFTDPQFERYVRYIVSRYASRNAVWLICGEYNELPNDYPGRLTEEFDRWGRLIAQIDPYHHLLSLHPTGRTSTGEFGNTTWMNFIGQQTPYATRDVVRDRQYGKPVVNLELRYAYPFDYGNGPNDETRYELWEITTAGGYWTNGFFTTYAPDKGGYDIVALPEEQLVGKALNEFLSSIPLSKMSPRTVASGSLLDDANHYLWYNRNGGPVSITVSGATEALQAVWIDTKTGKRTSAGIASNGQYYYTPLIGGDVALYIGPEIAVSYPPEQVKGFRIKR